MKKTGKIQQYFPQIEASISHTARRIGGLAAPDKLEDVTLNFAELSEEAKSIISDKLSGFLGSGKAIYIIKYDKSIAPKDMYTALQAAKDNTHENRAYPRINKKRKSEILYVGSVSDTSSRTKLRARLMQHLGYGYARTYALQLRHWVPKSGGSFTISAWRFNAIENHDLVLIEDWISDELSVMFGKKGSK